MFTHLFQLFLIVVPTGIAFLAFMTWVQDRREARADRRLNDAHAYAKMVLEHRAMGGEYDNFNVHEMATEYKKFYHAYLQNN